MTAGPRVVAELGRPETPDETAARKAESSRVYRSSQNVRNLIAALLVTVAIVAVIIFAVPRGSVPEQEPIDVAAVAETVSSSLERPIVVPDVPDTWRVNRAVLGGGDDVRAWEIVYAPASDAASGYVNVAQALDPDPGWATRQLGGATVTGTETIDGVTWDVFDLRATSRPGDITVALATTAGTDTVLVYGAGEDAETTVRDVAAGLVDGVDELTRTPTAEETP